MGKVFEYRYEIDTQNITRSIADKLVIVLTNHAKLGLRINQIHIEFWFMAGGVDGSAGLRLWPAVAVKRDGVDERGFC
jgi:hypothetical protein